VTDLTAVAHKVTAHSVQVIVPTETDHHDLKATGHMEVVRKVTGHMAVVRKVTGHMEVVHKATARSAPGIVPTETDQLARKVTDLTAVAHKVTAHSVQVIVPTETDHHARKVTDLMAVVLKATGPSVQAIVPMAIVLSVRATALVNALGSKTLLSARCQRVGVESHVVEPVKLSSTMKMQGSPLMQRLVLRPRGRHSKMSGFAPMVPTCDAVAARRFKLQRSASAQTSVSCLPMSPPPFARPPNQQLRTDARCLFRT